MVVESYFISTKEKDPDHCDNIYFYVWWKDYKNLYEKGSFRINLTSRF